MRRRLEAFICIAACLAATSCSVSASRGAGGVDRDVIAPAGSSTIAPYSPAIRSGGFVFLSGQVGLTPGTSALVTGGVTPETRQALENVRTILAAAGLTPADVLRCVVFLVDIEEYGAMNAVYGEFFGTEPPARSAVAVAALPLAARVEIECTARTPAVPDME